MILILKTRNKRAIHHLENCVLASLILAHPVDKLLPINACEHVEWIFFGSKLTYTRTLA